MLYELTSLQWYINPLNQSSNTAYMFTHISHKISFSWQKWQTMKYKFNHKIIKILLQEQVIHLPVPKIAHQHFPNYMSEKNTSLFHQLSSNLQVFTLLGKSNPR